jgi:hypothetical protein
MRPQVSPQVEIQAETLTTYLALVGFLPSMYKLMPLKLRIVQKLLAATFSRTPVQSFPVSDQMLAIG